MGEVVRAALIQACWEKDADAMVKKAVASVRQAAAEGARVVCLQELFNGPYFCQAEDKRCYDFADGRFLRDLDRGLIDEVRQLWAFYRDRRPDTCSSLAGA